ncbi:MAG: response regulator transcription factor, partial [Sedimentisphaerales bacterium]|nr:response regulator transcription factor [Sedimentisphaerales bacterium]
GYNAMNEDVSILLVEDEPKIRDGLRDFLEYHRYRVRMAGDGQAAADLVRQRRFDLILLDLMLPKISGEQLCQQWRQAGLTTPIIMLTAKGQESQKVAGLDLGADDYVTKPFSLEELRARIEAMLRRTRPERTVAQSFRFGDLEVNLAELTARRDDGAIALTRREGQLMQYFAAHRQRVISREELYKEVWGETMSELGTRTVDMHIAKLRGKIEIDTTEPQIIQTVRGAGYRYDG